MAIETSVEHEFFTNPTKEQTDYLKGAVGEGSGGASNKDIVDNESSKTIDNILEPEKETNTEEPAIEEKEEEKTISYIENETGKEFKFSPREWEDEWNKNKVEKQWQNLGRDREDMYDRYSGLDFNGKDASKEISSIGVPKTGYLKGLYEKDEQGKYKYEDKLNARKEARNENSILSKAIDGATALYDKTIGKAIDKVSAYKKDISEKAREVSDKRNEAYTNDAKLLAESNLGTSKPEKKATLEYDAAKFPANTSETSSYKPEVKMRVEGIEKPITKTQVDEIKKKVTEDLDFVKSYYEKNPAKVLETFYSTANGSTENKNTGLTYYDEAKTATLNNNKVIPTGTLTTELGHRVDVEFSPKGVFSKDNLKSMFGIGPGQQIGTATIHFEDGSTKTYALHQEPRVDDTIKVIDENGKQVGRDIYPNTPDAFMSDLSNVFDEIPGQAINEDAPTVKAAIERYNNIITEKEDQIKALDNAEVDMESLSSEWDRSVENSMPTVKVNDEGGEKEIIETSKGLENTLNQFTKPEDKEIATEWYNTYTPRVEQAIENAKADPVGNAGELAKVLDEARNALKPYANENFTNFNTAVNDYVGAVAGTYFINTQLYDRGVTADNAKESLTERIKTAYNSDKMSFGQKVLYSLGFGSKKAETDEGVMQLRNIAEQSLGRTSNLSENFKGAVMSSLLAQSVDNKSPIKDMMKDFLAFTGVQAINALSGFNPAVVGVTSLYAVSKGFERVLEEKTFKERNADNQKRLEAIKGGKDQEAMPTTKSEKVYNDTVSGIGQDIKHVSLGVANVVAGTISIDPKLIAYGVNELLQINSLNAAVKEFVGPENLKALEAVAAPIETSGEEKSDEKKKKKNITDLEEVVTDGNKQEGLDGINLPPLSDKDLIWLIKQPYMQNYNYE